MWFSNIIYNAPPRVQTILWWFQCDVATSMDYWILLQVSIKVMRVICIFVKTSEKTVNFISMVIYVAKYLMLVFIKYLANMTKRSNLSYLLSLWHLDNTMVFSFPKCVILKRQDCILSTLAKGLEHGYPHHFQIGCPTTNITIYTNTL